MRTESLSKWAEPRGAMAVLASANFVNLSFLLRLRMQANRLGATTVARIRLRLERWPTLRTAFSFCCGSSTPVSVDFAANRLPRIPVKPNQIFHTSGDESLPVSPARTGLFRLFDASDPGYDPCRPIIASAVTCSFDTAVTRRRTTTKRAPFVYSVSGRLLDCRRRERDDGLGG